MVGSNVEIDLGYGLFLRSDSRNWVLSEQHEGKNGPYFRDISFHSTIENVLNAVLERRTRLSGARSFPELLEAVRETKALLTKVQDSLEGVVAS